MSKEELIKKWVDDAASWNTKPKQDLVEVAESFMLPAVGQYEINNSLSQGNVGPTKENAKVLFKTNEYSGVGVNTGDNVFNRQIDKLKEKDKIIQYPVKGQNNNLQMVG